MKGKSKNWLTERLLKIAVPVEYDEEVKGDLLERRSLGDGSTASTSRAGKDLLSIFLYLRLVPLLVVAIVVTVSGLILFSIVPFSLLGLDFIEPVSLFLVLGAIAFLLEIGTSAGQDRVRLPGQGSWVRFLPTIVALIAAFWQFSSSRIDSFGLDFLFGVLIAWFGGLYVFWWLSLLTGKSPEELMVRPRFHSILPKDNSLTTDPSKEGPRPSGTLTHRHS